MTVIILESDFDDLDDQPYYEGDDHLCRHCGRGMLPNSRKVYCRHCRKYRMARSRGSLPAPHTEDEGDE